MIVLLAILGAYLLTPIGLLWAFLRHVRKDRYLFNVAVSIDQTINAVCRYMLNDTMIKPGGYRFGNADETVSSALGKNLRAGTLSKAGRIVVKILHVIDKNHVTKSIEENP